MNMKSTSPFFLLLQHHINTFEPVPVRLGRRSWTLLLRISSLSRPQLYLKESLLLRSPSKRGRCPRKAPAGGFLAPSSSSHIPPHFHRLPLSYVCGLSIFISSRCLSPDI